MYRIVLAFIFLVPSVSSAEELQIAVSAPEAMGEIEMSFSTVDPDPNGGVIDTIKVNLAHGVQQQFMLHLVTPEALLLVSQQDGSVVNLKTPVRILPGRHLAVSFSPEGKLLVGKWPTVTWKSRSDSLDALLNGDSVGTTTKTKSISPNTTHAIQWRTSDGRVVCNKAVSLEANVERTYTCDPDSGSVTG